MWRKPSATNAYVRAVTEADVVASAVDHAHALISKLAGVRVTRWQVSTEGSLRERARQSILELKERLRGTPEIDRRSALDRCDFAIKSLDRAIASARHALIVIATDADALHPKTPKDEAVANRTGSPSHPVPEAVSQIEEARLPGELTALGNFVPVDLVPKGAPPFGYRRQHGQLSPDVGEQAVIGQIRTPGTDTVPSQATGESREAHPYMGRYGPLDLTNDRRHRPVRSLHRGSLRPTTVGQR